MGNQEDNFHLLDHLKKGMRIGDKFVLERKLGSGTYGAVWEAHLISESAEAVVTEVAIKFVSGNDRES